MFVYVRVLLDPELVSPSLFFFEKFSIPPLLLESPAYKIFNFSRRNKRVNIFFELRNNNEIYVARLEYLLAVMLFEAFCICLGYYTVRPNLRAPSLIYLEEFSPPLFRDLRVGTRVMLLLLCMLIRSRILCWHFRGSVF